MVGILPNGVFTALLAYYQNAGLSAELLETNNPETLLGEKSIKITGRKFDLVILKFASGSIGAQKGLSADPSKTKNIAPTNINFNYIVKGVGKSNEKNLKAQVRMKTEGFISKKLLDMKWEGGRLADQLNTDDELKNMTMTWKVLPLKVEPDAKNNCVHIINEKVVRIIMQSWDDKETRVENLPPIEALNVIDRIADYVKLV